MFMAVVNSRFFFCPERKHTNKKRHFEQIFLFFNFLHFHTPNETVMETVL